MSKEQIWFELIKLAIQAIGAIFVARLAVRWALSRYKEEKTWERQLAAYVDVCTALGEMRMIVGKWAEQIEGRPYNDEFLKKMNERYRSAKTNLENTVAVASLILPRETYHLLSKLETDIEKIDPQDDPWDAYHQEYGLIDDALTDLIKQGREALGFPVHALDKKAWRKVQKSLESKLPD